MNTNNSAKTLDQKYQICDAKNIDDFKKVHPLLLELAGGENIFDMTPEKSADEFLKAQQQGYRQLYIEDAGKVIATIGIRPFYDPMCPQHGYIINNFIVAKPYRGRKIAEFLLDRAQKITMESGGNWMMGWALQNNPKLARWYKKLGCKVDYDLVEANF